MRRSRFSDEQIIAILREQEAGAATTDVCRRHGISTATLYKWKAKYGGLDVSEARRLGALEAENTQQKKLLAEAMLDNAMLKDITAKNGDARCEADGGGSCLRDLWCEPRAGVHGDRSRSDVGPLPLAEAG